MVSLDGVLAGVVTWIADNLLIDTVRITVPGSGGPVLNTDTGQLEQPPVTVLYEGPGAVQPSTATAGISSTPDAGQPWLQETESRYALLTPLTAPTFPKDAVVAVTAVHDPTRTHLMGRTWICPDPTQSGTVEVVRKTPLDQDRVPLLTEGP